MCGIAGIIDHHQKVDDSIVQRMNAAVKHRGPDGEGVYVNNNVGLGHTRLSILDLSDAGKQPMKDGSLVLTFNGEIYNYKELKAELEKEGYSFHSGTDSEVILKAYSHWGQDCVSRFNGMWAFALYDENANSLFCSRDRFGIKPFHYFEGPDTFVFGSEIGQLLPFLGAVRANRSILSDYLIFGLEDHSNDTFFEGIRKLPAGFNLTVDCKTMSCELMRYYQVNARTDVAEMSPEQRENALSELLTDAVSLRLRSDVKVGSCLSGGIDSSLLTAIASEQYRTETSSPFFSFTAKSTDPHNDESNWAKKVADHCGLDWKLTQPSGTDFRAVIQAVIALQQEPFGSPSVVMQYYVMRESREQGCTVLLDGQGGDETWVGYPRYLANIFKHTPLTEKWRLFNKMKANSALSAKTLLGLIVYFANPSVPIKRQNKKWSFIEAEFRKAAHLDVVRDRYNGKHSLTELQILELTSTQLPHLLRYEDRNSMAHAVESRLPYLDYRLVEFALGAPKEWKVEGGWTKYPLRRQIEKRLPKEVAWRRKKVGFEAPTAEWFRDSSFFDEAIKRSKLIHTIAPSIPYDRLDNRMRWRLFNTAIWEEQFNIQEFG